MPATIPTKYALNTAVSTTVVKPELAKSYIAQAATSRPRTPGFSADRSKNAMAGRAAGDQRAAMPARAIWASSLDFTPDTPTAPMQWPSTMMGTPPSSMPSIVGADRNDVRPPLMVSS